MTFRFLEELANQTNISNQPFRTFPHCGWPQLLSHGLLHVIPAIGGWFLTKKRGQHPRYKLTPGGLTQRVDLRINREFHMELCKLNQQPLHFFRGCNIGNYLEFKLLSLWKSLQLKLRMRKPKASITANITSLIEWNLYVQHLQEQSFSKFIPRFGFGSSLFLLKKTFIIFFWTLHPPWAVLSLLEGPTCINSSRWQKNHPIVKRKGKMENTLILGYEYLTLRDHSYESHEHIWTMWHPHNLHHFSLDKTSQKTESWSWSVQNWAALQLLPATLGSTAFWAMMSCV